MNAVVQPMVPQKPEHAVSTSAYIVLSAARWVPSCFRLGRVNVSPVVHYTISFPFVILPGGDIRCISVTSYSTDVPCSGPLPAFDSSKHVYDF